MRYGRTPAMKAYMEAHIPCEGWCGSYATDCHHIASRRLAGTDIESNFLALCPVCHAEYHRSWRDFIAERPWAADKVIASRQAFHLKTV